jgi:hypothetical protein
MLSFDPEGTILELCLYHLFLELLPALFFELALQVEPFIDVEFAVP